MIDRFLEQKVDILKENLGLTRTEAKREVYILAAFALGVDRLDLIKNPELISQKITSTKFVEYFEQRSKGRPIPYIKGQCEFFSLNFKLNDAVLCPRPETELLVEEAIRLAKEYQFTRILELGVGSGIVSISIAKNVSDIEIHGCDVSHAALFVANLNADNLTDSKNINFFESDWYSNVEGVYDLIVSNPPYIKEKDPHLKAPGVSFEPLEALVSGTEGLDALRHIISHSKSYLSERGWLLFEHGYDQADACRKLLSRNGFGSIFTSKDLSGKRRVSGGRI